MVVIWELETLTVPRNPVDHESERKMRDITADMKQFIETIQNARLLIGWTVHHRDNPPSDYRILKLEFATESDKMAAQIMKD